jgi:hypothetical protein
LGAGAHENIWRLNFKYYSIYLVATYFLVVSVKGETIKMSLGSWCPVLRILESIFFIFLRIDENYVTKNELIWSMQEWKGILELVDLIFNSITDEQAKKE